MKITSVLRSAAKFNSSFVPRASQSGFSGAVGNTPLIKLNQLSKETGCTIYGKAEYMNPGGSVKDRPALWILENAEKQGLLKPGDTLVEGSAGNTGIGLAQMARARGYKCVIYIPENLAKGKIDMLRLLGVEVHPVPVVPITDPMNFNHQAQRHAERTPNALWTNQFHNLSNRQAHIETTGPEIWKQTDGKITGFICATGTGGSLAGTTRYLKEVSDGKVKCYLADPPGSVLYNFVTKGEIERKGTDSFTEGIGQGRVTDNLAADASLLDGAIYVPDEETIAMAYRLLDEEGIFVGTSACLNVVAATKLAKKLGPGNTIVTLLCDAGERYAPRVFSKSWLESRNLYDSIPEHLRKYVVLE